jgi:chloride channel protein, CIC family
MSEPKASSPYPPTPSDPVPGSTSAWPMVPLRMPRVSLSVAQRMLLLSIVIGLFAGLLVVCFHIAIDLLRWRTVGLPFGERPGLTHLWPAGGAVIAAASVRFIFRHARGSGVIHTKAALHVSDGVVPASTVPGKFFACAVAIGTGNSLGPEDPALQMGAGVASIAGRVFRLPRQYMRLIAPIGAAAGIAAAFNTPITGVLFVIEEVIGSWNASVMGSILLSAVSAVVVSRWYLGDEPLFRVPALGSVQPADILVYAAIGVICGLGAAGYVRLLLWLKRHGDRWTSYAARILLPGLAGLCVGIVGFWLPQVEGPGYLTIDNALHGRFAWSQLLLLAIAKTGVTTLCFASGTPGGLFAPTLFVGAMIGGGIGVFAQQHWLLPQAAFHLANPSAFMLVGMGTFFAGVFRAPMTSIFMVFEVTASYQIILPAMVANTVGYLVAHRAGRIHLFDELARLEGIELPSVHEQRERQGLRVEVAMSAAGPLLTPDTTLATAQAALEGHQRQALVMRLAHGDYSTVHRGDLERVSDAPAETPLHELFALEGVPILYPDLGLEAALRQFRTHAALPVVGRHAREDVLGILTLEDVARAFRIERRAHSPRDGPFWPQPPGITAAREDRQSD